MSKFAECRTDITPKGKVADALARVMTPGGWDRERHEAFALVRDLLEKEGYKVLKSRFDFVGFGKNGHSAVFAVQPGQTGTFAPFAGKHVHIIAVGRADAYSGVFFAVREVSAQGEPTEVSRQETPSA